MRDALRRGLWLWPIAFSIPINKYSFMLYVFFSPLLTAFLLANIPLRQHRRIEQINCAKHTLNII